MSVWVNGTDKGHEGNWRWSDGSSWNFTAWATNQPNNCGEKENYLIVHKTP